MDACIIVGFIIVVALSSISLIGAWMSSDCKGIKISCTLNIFISLAAFLCAYIRNPFYFKDGVGIVGIIATIISIPVAILVGWQIYNALDLNKKVKGLEKSYNNLQNNVNRKIDYFDEYINKTNISIDEKIKDYDHNVEAVTKQLYGIVLLGEHRNNDALDSFMEALEEANKSSYKEPIEGILSFIRGMEEERRPVHPIPIETSNRYIGILQNLNIEDANSYISYIRSLEEQSKETDES